MDFCLHLVSLSVELLCKHLELFISELLLGQLLGQVGVHLSELYQLELKFLEGAPELVVF